MLASPPASSPSKAHTALTSLPHLLNPTLPKSNPPHTTANNRVLQSARLPASPPQASPVEIKPTLLSSAGVSQVVVGRASGRTLHGKITIDGARSRSKDGCPSSMAERWGGVGSVIGIGLGGRGKCAGVGILGRVGDNVYGLCDRRRERGRMGLSSILQRPTLYESSHPLRVFDLHHCSARLSIVSLSPPCRCATWQRYIRRRSQWGRLRPIPPLHPFRRHPPIPCDVHYLTLARRGRLSSLTGGVVVCQFLSVERLVRGVGMDAMQVGRRWTGKANRDRKVNGKDRGAGERGRTRARGRR